MSDTGPTRVGPSPPKFVDEVIPVTEVSFPPTATKKPEGEPKKSFWSRFFIREEKPGVRSPLNATIHVTDTVYAYVRPEAMARVIGRQLLQAQYDNEGNLILYFDGFEVSLGKVARLEVTNV